MKTKKTISSQQKTQSKKKIYLRIKKFLVENANAIQKLATQHHKEFIGGKRFRSEIIKKYQANHITVVEELAKHLDQQDIKKGLGVFKILGETLAKDSVQDGLTIEEAVDGIVFLKQALWEVIENNGLLNELTTQEYHRMSSVVGIYIDVVSTKIAFTYHKERQYIENNLRYLAEASKILSSSLDYQTTLNTIASLAVPQVGDWCAVAILDSKGELQQVAVAHKDPKKVKWAKELYKTNPPQMSDPSGVPRVIKTGKSEIYPIITDELLRVNCKTEKEYKLAKSIGFTSGMIVPIFSQTNPIGAITFVTAETSRHYTQADLIMAEELGTRASVAIENARLYKGSQEAITLRDDFISVASHELKTPVTSVKMFTQILKKHSEAIGDVKAVNHLSKMDRQLNKLTELIYDLLNISKIQAGRMEFNEELFDFDKTVKEVIDVLQQSANNHTIVVQGETNRKVRGDEERVGQVINNLISNAIKYSPKADKVILKLSSNKTNVHVAVRDFGIGIEKEHLSKIFERFYRVYDTTDKTFPGLGIGLYISSEIVKRHGGKFWVDSDIGKGSVFHFSIPTNGKKHLKKGE